MELNCIRLTLQMAVVITGGVEVLLGEVGGEERLVIATCRMGRRKKRKKKIQLKSIKGNCFGEKTI